MNALESEVVPLVVAAARGLSDNPPYVNVQAQSDGACLMVFISCATQDTAKLIGKQGANINALRKIACAIGAKHRAKVVLVVKE